MTKGGSSKPNMLGRLFFGEKRKQHTSPSRHRSATRNGGSAVDVSTSGGGGDTAKKNPINLHDWADWRTQLNEQMGNAPTERTDLKQMRQFLHSNSFYQQHSRDASNGRYNGVRLLFSIPHAKLKPELNEGSRGGTNKNTSVEGGHSTTPDQNNVRSNSDDCTTTNVNSVSAGSPTIIDKTISQLLPKSSIRDTGGFLRINEQMIASDTARTRRSLRTPCLVSDRVHGTLQKAVKDGNVLEKIKAFEMQAAAAQAGLTINLGGSNGIHNRMQSVSSIIQSAAHRTMSPPTKRPIQHPISPMPIQNEPSPQQQQYIRSHRGRYVHPAQQRRDGNPGPLVGRESRKGAHVLEPAHGDIILKRRTPSQKTVNDEDHSITAITSMALTAPQGQHRQQHLHHRSGASRSRHRQESVHDKRSTNNHENGHKKHQQKQKEPPPASSSTKTSTRRRWLKGRKETPTETATESVKEDASTTKTNKSNKNKKKYIEQEKLESIKKATSPTIKGKTTSPTTKGKSTSAADNNRVYGVPNTIVHEQTKFERTSPQPPSRIEEENESDREEKNIEIKNNYAPPKEEHVTQNKECNPIVQRRPSKTKYHQKLSSTDGEILTKVDDDTRFSRPTDDHAHRSELNDEDDECKSEGDVFIEESSVTNINPHQQQQPSSNFIRRHLSQCSVDEVPYERRWQWSKESGGLIDKGSRKKKQQQQTPPTVPCKNKIIQEQEQVVYETPKSEQIQVPASNIYTLKKKQSLQSITTIEPTNESNNNKQFSKQILHAINNNSTNNDQEQCTTDDFFENGPHTNPEETIANITSSA